MPLPFDVISTVNNERKANRRAVQQKEAEISAVLANEQKVWNVPGKNGNEVYVRLLGNTEGENATYQPSTTAFVRGNFFEYAGSPVLLKYNKHGALVLIGPDETQVAQAGDRLSLSALNSGSKQNRFLNLDNVLRLIGRPVSRGSKDSLLVSVAQFIYDHYGNYNTFNGMPLQADKLDLASFVPAAGEQRIVQLWLDTFNNNIQVTTSTAQALTVDIVNADFEEAWLGSNRYQDWLPLQSYLLRDNAATITQKELHRDHRQFINMPDELGNETTLTINTRIRSDRQWSVDNSLTIPTGYTLAIETGGEVIISTRIPHVKISGDTMTGQLLFTGDGRVIRKFSVAAQQVKAGGVSPTEAIIGVTPVKQFSQAVTQSVNVEHHIPNDWDTSTDIVVHIHWAPVNGNAGDVVWDIDYNSLASNSGEQLTDATTALSVTDSTETLQDEPLESDPMTFVAANLALEDILSFKFSRDTSDGNDTYAAAASLIRLDFEYVSNSRGRAV